MHTRQLKHNGEGIITQELDLHTYAAGIYYLHYRSAEGSGVIKLTMQQ
jgi:hypothetical protein